jgi:hypothetical protein
MFDLVAVEKEDPSYHRQRCDQCIDELCPHTD